MRQFAVKLVGAVPALGLWLALGTGANIYADTNPVVSVTVNGRLSADIFPGMPLLVSIWVLHSDAMNPSAVPILITNQIGPWTNSIFLQINDAATNAQTWPFHGAGTFPSSVLLDSTNYARIDQWLTPTQTLTLSTGQYSLVATLDTTGISVPGAWQGSEESVPAGLTIRAEPVPLGEVDAENKYSQLAQYYLFAGDSASSLGQANALLALFPTNITGLRLKAAALQAMARPEEAESAIDQAINEVFARNPNPAEPPENLYSLSLALQKQRLAPPQLSVTETNQTVWLAWTRYSEFFYWIESSADQIHWSLLVANPPGNTYSFSAPTNGVQQYYRISRAETEEVMAAPLLQAIASPQQTTLSWFGYPWFSYRLEASPDLMNWSLLSTNFSINTDTYSFAVQPVMGAQFFRVAR